MNEASTNQTCRCALEIVKQFNTDLARQKSKGGERNI
jgi:hypothetical protein